MRREKKSRSSWSRDKKGGDGKKGEKGVRGTPKKRGMRRPFSKGRLAARDLPPRPSSMERHVKKTGLGENPSVSLPASAWVGEKN